MPRADGGIPGTMDARPGAEGAAVRPGAPTETTSEPSSRFQLSRSLAHAAMQKGRRLQGGAGSQQSPGAEAAGGGADTVCKCHARMPA